MSRLWLALGSLFGLLAVAMAAWAAHGLPQRLGPAALAAVQNGLTMQGWHALALLATGLLAERRAGTARALGHAAGAAFALGALLFCGAVYAGAIGGMPLGRVAPTGGLLLMLGWLLLLLAALSPAAAGARFPDAAGPSAPAGSPPGSSTAGRG
ncbi:DUF423 domain-containing protein [Roseomonas sp. NAR14]|uniref:DUF423 domain-containing protein n=1 Tax=Roseomonas acroporae TaxID=2937791 RepID=A0A9X1YFI6_9PROT|nr:DUF423 domain-containing protein [Roseomonas acroporae]MCK8785281.1 DUF423 domain-containing protein [Roseomonas acroporae]